MWATFAKCKAEAQRSRESLWKAITDTYNVRVVIEHRISQVEAKRMLRSLRWQKVKTKEELAIKGHQLHMTPLADVSKAFHLERRRWQEGLQGYCYCYQGASELRHYGACL